MEVTPWKLPHAAYTLAVTYSNIIRGSYLEEFTSCKIPYGMYTMEVTLLNLHN